MREEANVPGNSCCTLRVGASQPPHLDWQRCKLRHRRSLNVEEGGIMECSSVSPQRWRGNKIKIKCFEMELEEIKGRWWMRRRAEATSPLRVSRRDHVHRMPACADNHSQFWRLGDSLPSPVSPLSLRPLPPKKLPER